MNLPEILAAHAGRLSQKQRDVIVAAVEDTVVRRVRRADVCDEALPILEDVLGAREAKTDAAESRFFDSDGFDCWGYDPDGYNPSGYDRNGYDRDGYSRSGWDRDGYSRSGWDRHGNQRPPTGPQSS